MDNTNTQDTINTELIGLRAIKEFNMQVRDIPDSSRPYNNLCATLAQIVGNIHLVLLVADTEDATLEFQASYPAQPPKNDDEKPALSIFNPERGSLLETLLNDGSLDYVPSDSDDSLAALLDLVPASMSVLQVLKYHDVPIGLVAIYGSGDTPISQIQRLKFVSLIPSVTATLSHIQRHLAMTTKVEDIEREGRNLSAN